MDPIVLLIQGAFFVLFAAALLRYVRHRGPVERGVVLVFATTAALFLLSMLTSYAPALASVARPITLAMLVAQPYLILRLVNQIRPVPNWAARLAFAGFVVVTAGLLLSTRSAAVILALVGYFAIVDTAAAVGFLQVARRRRGAHRLRLTLAGIATACFGLAIVVAGVGSAANQGAGGGPTVLVAGRLLALVAALGYLGAFLPPRWLTGFFHRAAAFDLARGIVAAHAGLGPGPLWEQLTTAAQSILGASDVHVLEDPSAAVAVGPPQRRTAILAPVPGTRRGADLRIPLVLDGRDVATLTAHLDGQPLFVEDDIATVALLGSFTARAVQHEADLARLRETESALMESAALRESESRFRLFLEADPNAIIAADRTGLIRWATRSSVDLFQRDVIDLVGRPLTDLVDLPSVDGPAVGDQVDGPLVRRFDTIAFRADGSSLPVEVALRRLDDEGLPMTIAVVSDSSWRQEANEIRDRFVGVLSHELRTPITSIYGGAQVLLKRPTIDAGARHEILVGLADESERLQRIIENLLILAKVERGADFFEPRPVLVQRVVADVIDRERAIRPGATIHLDLAPGIPVVSGDDDQLVQVLRNLLSNAVKYAGDDAVIDVRVAFEAPSVVVTVRDDGPGFPPEEADQLFGLYYRSARSQAAPGAGIGLFVCRHLVEAMGGRMWAGAAPEGGAEFGFALRPYEDPDEPESPPTDQPRRDATPSEPALRR